MAVVRIIKDSSNMNCARSLIENHIVNWPPFHDARVSARVFPITQDSTRNFIENVLTQSTVTIPLSSCVLNATNASNRCQEEYSSGDKRKTMLSVQTIKKDVQLTEVIGNANTNSNSNNVMNVHPSVETIQEAR